MRIIIFFAPVAKNPSNRQHYATLESYSYSNNKNISNSEKRSKSSHKHVLIDAAVAVAGNFRQQRKMFQCVCVNVSASVWMLVWRTQL